MFNDEIELVRLEAIESLTLIANHITLQVHQVCNFNPNDFS
jgi:hypothetical protein